MKIPRRQFMGGMLAGFGGLMMAGCSKAVNNSTIATFDPYDMVPLGNTGIEVSRVGLGTGMNGFNQQSNQTRLGKEKFHTLIRGCFDRGIRWFDLADLYGTHPYLIPALKEIPREQYIIVSKMWFRPKGLVTDERPDADVLIERFLKELGTDYLDVVLLHCMTEKDWPTIYEKQLTILDTFKAKGVIRAKGCSCHSLEALKTAAEEPWVDSVHTRINPYGVMMDDKPEVVVPVIERIHNNGKGVVGMKIIGAGKFRDSDDKRNHSIDFALNSGVLDTMVVGFESLAEVDDFAWRVRQTPRRTTMPALT